MCRLAGAPHIWNKWGSWLLRPIAAVHAPLILNAVMEMRASFSEHTTRGRASPTPDGGTPLGSPSNCLFSSFTPSSKDASPGQLIAVLQFQKKIQPPVDSARGSICHLGFMTLQKVFRGGGWEGACERLDLLKLMLPPDPLQRISVLCVYKHCKGAHTHLWADVMADLCRSAGSITSSSTPNFLFWLGLSPANNALVIRQSCLLHILPTACRHLRSGMSVPPSTLWP
mmetsp:Transcript_99712/g.171722  ORF Transcript_99712/g.171722 Transcript_99712/m.171722 type:complete len:227 (-) Transcript_99712:2073-2753(-)